MCEPHGDMLGLIEIDLYVTNMRCVYQLTIDRDVYTNSTLTEMCMPNSTLTEMSRLTEMCMPNSTLTEMSRLTEMCRLTQLYVTNSSLSIWQSYEHVR
jgi:hypothetical protein